LIEGVLDNETYTHNINELKKQKEQLNKKLEECDSQSDKIIEKIERVVNFSQYALQKFNTGGIETKKSIIRALQLNWQLNDKKVAVELAIPFQTIQKTLEIDVVKNFTIELANNRTKTTKNALSDELITTWSG